MSKEQYIAILEDHMYPSAMDLFKDGDYFFQHDNDPQHTARVVRRWLEDQQIPMLPWPAQSPDLNPIENLWATLEQQLRECQPVTREQLFQALQEGWRQLDISFLTNLADSMPARCQAVIDADGFATEN